MKIIGYLAIVIGVIFAVSALFMDVTVATSGGYRVNNLGLMSSRQNYMIFGGFVAIAGIIIALVGDKLKAKSVRNFSQMPLLRRINKFRSGEVQALRE
ncbi:hypothetical protein [Klebsiella pneumoniae]|uniref:hypothetical protein n=1 Tax=Klebsiella pneumoniae TaxID=573 RepID=UPI0021CBBA19